MKLDRETAEKILEAFGPCTSVYECRTVDDLIANAERSESLAAFVRLLLSVEDVWTDRWLSGLADSGEGGVEAAVAEARDMMRSIRERLVESGLVTEADIGEGKR